MLNDLISRQAAIDAICEHGTALESRGITVLAVANHKQVTVDLLESLPSAEPTLYGYNVRDLDLIARILQEEGLPPERVKEALTDISSIIAIVQKDFDRSLQRAMQILE